MRLFRRSSPPSRKFVFIVTYGRSGSTLLQSVLASIPGSHISGENYDVLGGLLKAYRSAVQTKLEYGAQARTAPGDPWRGAHRVDPDRFNQKLAEAFIEEILGAPPTATLVGFKEIRYFGRDDVEDCLDYLRLTFRPGLLIFNRRNPEDVARSADALEWWEDRQGDIVEEIRAFDHRLETYASLHADCCVMLNYDDYIRDAQVLQPLFERLGAPFDLQEVQSILSLHLDH